MDKSVDSVQFLGHHVDFSLTLLKLLQNSRVLFELDLQAL